MRSIYDDVEITLACSDCGSQVIKRVHELRTKVQIPCSACGSAIPVGNLTELVADAVTKRLGN